MSISTRPERQPSVPSQRVQQPARRLWRVPTSKAWWLTLIGSLSLYAVAFLYYWYTFRGKGLFGLGLSPAPVQTFPGVLGVMAFGVVALTASYTLRRRFARVLPGKVQDWLWAHTWLGITALLIAMLHSNFDHITHNLRYTPQYFFFTNNGGAAALYSLIILVLTGIANRLFYIWQSRIIARDASTNGVGIVESLAERILALEYTVERLYAGKSASFKTYCIEALRNGTQTSLPLVSSQEQADFQRAQEALATRARLLQSLHRQQRARRLIARWRVVHITVACLALVVICLHVSVALVPALLARLKL